MRERAAFGPELRRAREHRGLTLDQVAASTKVSASIYAGLERNDLSRWPSGLFRRAFVRAYADAIGLDPEDVCRRFVELFPEEDGEKSTIAPVPAPPAPVEAADQSPQPRLMLAVAPAERAPASDVRRRLAAGLLDVALVMVPAALVSVLAGAGWFWVAAAVIGATGHVVALAVHGITPGSWLLLRSRPAIAVHADVASSARRRPEGDIAAATAPRRHATRHVTPHPVARGRRVQH